MGAKRGIFNGKKVFDPDCTTAQICDDAGFLFFCPIKYQVGDFFFTRVNRQWYCFRVIETRVKTAKNTGARTFKTVFFDTSHYLPLSTDDVKMIEIILNKNHLPKIDNKLLGVLKILGKTEKRPFKIEDIANEVANEDPQTAAVHDITLVKAKLLEHEKRYSKEISELINFMALLQTEKIVTPVMKLVDFIEHDCKTVDPRIMGTIYEQAVRTHKEALPILNPTLNAKKSWIVMILLLGIVIAVIGLVYFAWQAGAFDNAGSLIPIGGGGSGDYSEESLKAKYPSGPALRAAVDSGQLDYKKLPPIAKKIYDDTPAPGGSP